MSLLRAQRLYMRSEKAKKVSGQVLYPALMATPVSKARMCPVLSVRTVLSVQSPQGCSVRSQVLQICQDPIHCQSFNQQVTEAKV